MSSPSGGYFFLPSANILLLLASGCLVNQRTLMSPSLLSGKHVAIVGGGPVGLTLARILQQRGAAVVVYERDAGPNDVRTSGGTLDIHAEDGQLALAAAGVMAEFRRLARPTAERMADLHGTIVVEEPAESFDRPEIDRVDLHRLLLASLAPGTVVWGQHFQGLEAHDGRLVLRFAGQPDRVADLVVGANGTRSKVRAYVTGTVPEFSGTVALQGSIPDPDTRCPAFAALVNGGNMMARGEGKMLFAHTKADGGLHYYISFRQPADWFAQRGLPPEPAAVTQFLAAELANWAPVYHEGFRATTAFAFLATYRVPLVADRPVPLPITLVGDAAHAMPPFAGIGVNIGLVDALQLADNLTSGQFGSLEAAIRAYERTMHGYAHAAQEMSAEAELIIHSELSAEEMIAATRGPGEAGH